MLQHSEVRVLLVSNSKLMVACHEEFRVPPIKMFDESADMVIECMLRGSPINFESAAEMKLIASKWSALFILYVLDRAGVNTSCMCWLFELLLLLTSSNVYPHLEPCHAHGAALVKAKSSAGKATAAALNSWSRYLRDGRVNELFERLLMEATNRQPLRPCRENRPEMHKEWATHIIQALFHDEVEEHLTTVGKDGKERRSGTMIALEELLECLDIEVQDIPETGDARHVVVGFVLWGCGRAGEIAVPPAGGIDETPEMRCEIQRRVYAWTCKRAWAVACASRWIHISTLRRRFVAGALACETLPAAICDMQLEGHIDESMVAALERRLDADAGDFSSRQQLRLLRVASVVCKPLMKQKMVIELVGERFVDKVLYLILGKKGDRIQMKHLLDPIDSPLCDSQENISLCFRTSTCTIRRGPCCR